MGSVTPSGLDHATTSFKRETRMCHTEFCCSCVAPGTCKVTRSPVSSQARRDPKNTGLLEIHTGSRSSLGLSAAATPGNRDYACPLRANTSA
jgi:hypothetical protein